VYKSFFIFYYDYEGVTFITFVRNPLYPKGNNASKDEGLWYLTFYVALFLIHSIWEQVPNSWCASFCVCSFVVSFLVTFRLVNTCWYEEVSWDVFCIIRACACNSFSKSIIEGDVVVDVIWLLVVCSCTINSAKSTCWSLATTWDVASWTVPSDP
jgi:hypothetical protein